MWAPLLTRTPSTESMSVATQPGVSWSMSTSHFLSLSHLPRYRMQRRCHSKLSTARSSEPQSGFPPVSRGARCAYPSVDRIASFSRRSISLTVYQQLRMGRGLHDAIWRYLRGLQGRPEAPPQEERTRDLEDFRSVYQKGVGNFVMLGHITGVASTRNEVQRCGGKCHLGLLASF